MCPQFTKSTHELNIWSVLELNTFREYYLHKGSIAVCLTSCLSNCSRLRRKWVHHDISNFVHFVLRFVIQMVWTFWNVKPLFKLPFKWSRPTYGNVKIVIRFVVQMIPIYGKMYLRRYRVSTIWQVLTIAARSSRCHRQPEIWCNDSFENCCLQLKIFYHRIFKHHRTSLWTTLPP